MIPTGPIETEPPGYRTNSEQHTALLDTLHTAGVELGDYDQRIVDWLTLSPGWEWATVATIASWVKRAGTLAESATEYRVALPEGGGTNLIVRRQGAMFGSGWSAVVPGYGGGRAWTTEGWQESISALSADRLFCWPDAPTAVTETRRALADTE
ncbi:hypothetical protein [Streptomyces poriferorum]|uniref:DUF317 domain-containing protein n=1 Tax=Streptomyces poriferorum TaxID=2798799 RepID=A0ABY9J078_9ACTN|nr:MULTISPECIES: hypothetical protein [unclassified Streptomyces]MDP5310407.1 hypothetical protein [Streptomyces sp. Alt4]WLQ60439.1 hypothetical protein P8A19_35670 [Streptomyces sp. Alt2]